MSTTNTNDNNLYEKIDIMNLEIKRLNEIIKLKDKEIEELDEKRKTDKEEFDYHYNIIDRIYKMTMEII